MEEPKMNRIKLPLEVDIYKKNYKKGYEQSYMNLFDSNILSYDVLRVLFGYLNGRDLWNVAMVCRSWSVAANHEKNLRGSYLRACSLVHIENFDNGRSKHESGICFDCLRYNITQSTLIPAIGFFFQPAYLNYGILEDCINDELFPENCKIIKLYADTVILSKYHGNYKCISTTKVICALLPQIPNVEISMIKVTDGYGYEFKKYMDIIERACSRDHKMSTCLMIFCNINSCNVQLEMYSFAQRRLGNDDKNTILLCDANQSSIYYKELFDEYQYDESYCIAVLITGSIRSWSIVIECEHKTREQYEEELKSLKEKVHLQKHSVGFIFGCDTEKDQVSDLVKVESFNRLFPKVPLIGCLGKCMSMPYYFDNNHHLISVHKHNCSATYMILTYDL